MSEPRDLFRLVAAAQDARLKEAPPLDGMARAVLRTGGRRVRRLRVALMASLAVTAGAVVVLQSRPRPQAVSQPVVAQADSELPLRFPDGSQVTFRPGSLGRVQRSSGSEAVIGLEEGGLEAQVVHTDRTRWTMQAGPFRVHVTGTRFGMTWSRARRALTVTLHEGSVLVSGGVLGAGVPLRAGQRLTVDLDAGHVRTEPLEIPLPPAVVQPPPAPPAQPPSPRPAEDWMALAESGAYEKALVAAERPGLASRLRTLDARGLLTLGDVARYARAPATAERAFQTLVERFPGDALAPDAVFSLGRLAFEGDRAGMAARWFQRYVSSWPAGPLADQAAGRLVESLVRAGDRQGAAEAARAYLQRAPDGPHAPLAREVIERR